MTSNALREVTLFLSYILDLCIDEEVSTKLKIEVLPVRTNQIRYFPGLFVIKFIQR